MKNKNFISFIVIIASTIILQSCDKIDPPFVEKTTGSSTSGNAFGFVNLQNIKGVASDFKVTDNWISDSSALKAVWTVTPSGSGADGSITFTWHEVAATISISSASGIISFSGPVTINGGDDYGTLSFKYDGSFTSSGSAEGYVVVYVVQNILIEDYTGAQCGNCPPAAEKITELKSIYGDRIVAVTVHAGFYAVPLGGGNMYTYDFRTAVGNELDIFFNPNETYPNGLINRLIFNGSWNVDWHSFASHINEIITQNKLPDAGIKITNTYTASDSTLKTKVKTRFFNDLTGTYKICVYLIEDSVQNWQKYYFHNPENIPDYWHREVLRGSENGTWGDALSPSTNGSIIEKNYTMTVKNDYRAPYSKVVAFIYNDATKEIIQVKEAPIIQ